MTYYRIPPEPRLAPFVEYFGLHESTEHSSALTQILPTTNVELLVHFGDPFERIDTQNGQTTVTREPAAYICGQRTRPYYVRATGNTGILVCSFYPIGLQAFTGGSLEVHTDNATPLEEVFPDTSRLVEQIAAPGPADTRVRLLQQWLLQKLAPCKQDLLIRQAALNINRSCGNQTVAHLAGELGISARQLDRRFLRTTGISPKKFSSIIRFQKALAYRQLNVSPAEVAADCGYYDQAHMHHEFQNLAGLKPSTLFNAGNSPLMQHFNQSQPDVSRFYNTLYLQ